MPFKSNYLKLRQNYFPKRIKIIFLLESPPVSGDYFYDPDGRATEQLFSSMMKPIDYQPSSKIEGLAEFARQGYFLADAIAKQNGFTKNKSSETVETILELIKSTLSSGEDVLISGFGKFCVKDKRERRGRNPATGEDMILVPRRVVTFRCSRKLRNKINW